MNAYPDPVDAHYHVFTAPDDGRRVRSFSTRATDVFRTREAATKWARSQRPASRRIVRQCAGGPDCPGDELPAERTPLPRPRPRRRRPAELVRIRRALDGLGAAELARVAELLEEMRAPPDGR